MQGPGAASWAVQNNTFLGSWGGGHSAEFAQAALDEEEEAELAWEGAGLREPGIPSLPGSPSIGADETYTPVCMMKSSWLATSLPSSRCSHPLCASPLPGLLPQASPLTT